MIKEISVNHNQVAKAQRDSDDYVLPHRLCLESARADDATEWDARNHDCDVSHEASSSVDKDVATSQKHLDIDDATFMSSITLELREAARKCIRYARERRQENASVPIEVQKAMLEDSFPHVLGHARGGVPTSDNRGSVDSMKAEHSVESSVEDLLAMAAEIKTSVDPDDCIKTLTNSEITHLRNAMLGHEKQRLMETLENISDQMKVFHEVVEENQALKREIAKMKTRQSEHNLKVSDLEKTLVDMKLRLAQAQSQDDHHRQYIAKLESENLEQLQLLQKGPHQANQKGRPGRVELHHRANGFAQSLQLGKERLELIGLLDRSISKSNHVKPSEDYPLMSSLRSQKEGKSRRAASHGRRTSYAPEESASGFMHWDSCERSSDSEGQLCGQPLRSRSFRNPKENSKKAHEFIGAELCLPLSQNEMPDPEDRLTILSNITDFSFLEDMDRDMLTNRAVPMPKDKEPPMELGKHLSHTSSSGSFSTLTFEAAKPRLQHKLGFKNVNSLRKTPRERNKEGIPLTCC